MARRKRRGRVLVEVSGGDRGKSCHLLSLRLWRRELQQSPRRVQLFLLLCPVSLVELGFCVGKQSTFRAPLLLSSVQLRVQTVGYHCLSTAAMFLPPLSLHTLADTTLTSPLLLLLCPSQCEWQPLFLPIFKGSFLVSLLLPTLQV